jgi:hypothetical protein
MNQSMLDTTYNETYIAEYTLDKPSLIKKIDYTLHAEKWNYTNGKGVITSFLQLYDESDTLLSEYELGSLSVSVGESVNTSKTRTESLEINLSKVKYIRLKSIGHKYKGKASIDATIYYQENFASTKIKDSVFNRIINNKYIQEYVTTGGVDE